MARHVYIPIDADEVLDELDDQDIIEEAKKRGLLVFEKGDSVIERALSHLYRGEIQHAITMLDTVFDVRGGA